MLQQEGKKRRAEECGEDADGQLCREETTRTDIDEREKDCPREACGRQKTRMIDANHPTTYMWNDEPDPSDNTAGHH